MGRQVKENRQKMKQDLDDRLKKTQNINNYIKYTN